MHLTKVWRKDPALYERIFIQRAEWVLILETSFALALGAALSLSLAVLGFRTCLGQSLSEACLFVVLLFLSYRSAGTGLQRMTVHNQKVMDAVVTAHASDAQETEREPGAAAQVSAP